MVACADFLGCGSSERYEPDSDEAWGPQLMSNWIGQLDVLMDDPRIGPGPVVLVSQGGLAPVAISLASRRPGRVQSPMLCAPPSWANLGSVRCCGIIVTRLEAGSRKSETLFR